MENTPSVTTMMFLAPSDLACLRHASSSSMLLLAYRYLFALHNRTPSMIEAWLRLSLTMASSFESKGSNTPPLASKAAA